MNKSKLKKQSEYSLAPSIAVGLKKQSQFLKGQNDVKLMLTMCYGDFDGLRQRENKANLKSNERIKVTERKIRMSGWLLIKSKFQTKLAGSLNGTDDYIPATNRYTILDSTAPNA